VLNGFSAALEKDVKKGDENPQTGLEISQLFL